MPSEQKRAEISRKQWLVLLALMLGVFLGALDISIVSPALPDIARDLNISDALLSWIITLYILVYVLAVPLMSSLSDKYGRKNVLLINIALFAIGSLFAGFSQNLTHLLIARGLQALGAGGLFPIASAVIGKTFPKERHGMALGFIGMVWGVAAIIGPLIGGWMTQWYGWNSIFYVSFVLSLLVLVLIWKILDKTMAVHPQPFDWLGMGILGAGLVMLTYGLNRVDVNILVASIVVLVIFFFVEKYPKAPIIPLKFFRNSQLNISFVLSFTRGMTEAGLVFLPFYAMVVLDIKAGLAGTLIIATAISMFLFTGPAGMLVDKVGAKKVLLFGALVTGIGAALMISANTLAEFIGYQLVLGLGLSAMSGAPIRYIVLHQTSEREKASAQSLVSLFSSFGIMVGSAIAGSMLAIESKTGIGELAGFHKIYLMVAIILLVAALFVLGLDNKPAQPESEPDFKAAGQKDQRGEA
ncbi:hypothetical protein MNBD_ALPHA12-921 [hydrothermal vent metagenome]|uniref:Major facilitator superfamily (MFS) profile domain-containing protein n=1 Tax=hydrothermal vent metagenome TaxID=652676 RepID=A0A3B0T9G4_9ZZZZ